MNKAKTKVVRKERIGPFRVDAGMDEADKGILKFVFESEFPLKENIVDTSSAGSCTRDGAQKFQPNGWLGTFAVNYFTEILHLERGEDHTSVFFPTFFAEKLFPENAKPKTSLGLRSKDLCVRRFDHLIHTCEKIFILVHDSDHYFLFVVRLDTEEAEYWDSMHGTNSRRNKCKTILQALDHIYRNNVFVTSKKKKFTEFRLVDRMEAKQSDADCAIFVIRHMQRYGEEWWRNFKSEETRIELLLYMIKSKYNSLLRMVLQETVKKEDTKEDNLEKAARMRKVEGKQNTRARSKKGVNKDVRRSH
ncbi:hypothetical protein ACLB2K_069205 [Fragaria x ananassa]